MKFQWLLAVSLAALSCAADVTEFFSNGHFNSRSESGSGNNAFRAGSATVCKWNREAGFMTFSLKEGQKTGLVSVRLFNTAQLDAGRNFTINVRFRGKGNVRFEFGRSVSKMVSLSPEWKKYTLNFKAPANLNKVVFLRLDGPGTTVDMDDLSFSVISQDILIVPPVGALLVKPGEAVPPQIFNVYPRDVKGEFIFYDQSNNKQSSSAADSLLGKAEFPGFNAGKSGFYRVIYTTGAVSAMRDIVVAPEAEFKALNSAAKAVDLKGKPLRMLFLADSLTDYDRDHNHAAIIAGLLDKYNPGSVTFRNAACGGDQNPRMAQRIKSRNTYRGYMYDGLWQEKYDLVFLMLGQNDTVAFPKTNFSKPQFDIKTVEENMRFILDTIKKQTNARIVVCSGVSTPVNTYPGFHFGVPELVEAYNACARKIAAEYGVEYCDIYSPLKTFNNDERSLYFVADKVHLSAKGHRFIALQLLDFLRKK